jgi:ABC-type transport system involved in cytochrome c biogenesis permease subunit
MLKPEIHDQTLMPALQSPWFIPHVTVYMFSYSLLGCAFLIGVVRLFKKDDELFCAADTLVYIGVAFLTFGMLSGSIWAKSAWGHFWNWDPKETWALITWLVYLLYIHLRLYRRDNVKLLCFLLIFAFACLQMCWWGINFLPSAADSIHVY